MPQCAPQLGGAHAAVSGLLWEYRDSVLLSALWGSSGFSEGVGGPDEWAVEVARGSVAGLISWTTE